MRVLGDFHRAVIGWLCAQLRERKQKSAGRRFGFSVWAFEYAAKFNVRFGAQKFFTGTEDELRVFCRNAKSRRGKTENGFSKIPGWGSRWFG